VAMAAADLIRSRRPRSENGTDSSCPLFILFPPMKTERYE
jgi:hypothetical protein